MTKTGVIYCLTSPSGKRYVGQSWNIEKRLNYYKRIDGCKGQQKIYNALKRYGFDSFSVEILDYCFDQDQMDDAECYWIAFYDTIKNGYNIREGGSRGQWSDEMRLLISERTKEAMKANPRTKESYEIGAEKCKGQTRSDVVKTLMSKNRTGKGCKDDNAWYGKPLPEDHRRKIGEGNKGKIRSEETKKKISESGKRIAYWSHHEMSESMIQNKSKSAQKFEYTLTDPYGNIFVTRSLRMFCKDNNLGDSSMFSKVSRGLLNHYKGWTVTRNPIDEIISEAQPHE
jgi:group I intron endonuclease